MPDQPTRTRDVRKTIIVNSDGSLTQLSTVDEQAVTYEDGGHQYCKTEIRVTALDGHVLGTGEIAFQCTNCFTGPWSAQASTTCTACHRRICLATCTKQTDAGALCKPCHDAAHKAAFWTYLRSII